MKHRIVIRCEAHSLSDFALKQQIAKCITAALDKQGVDTPCEINVLVTDDEGIRAINKAYRQIDKATDVLSFPMFELTPGKLPASWESYKDPDTGLCRSATWPSASSGPSSRRLSSATAPAARSAISPSIPFCTCWATTMWTRAR